MGPNEASWQRAEIEARQAIASRILAGLSYRAGRASLHIRLHLPKARRADAFRAEAERRGVRVLTAEFFAVGHGPASRPLRICLGYESSRERLAAGLEIVAELCSGREGVGPLVL